MRLIDADALSKQLHDDWDEVDASNFDEYFLSKQPTIEINKWIPISERLPEKYGEYLITWTTPYFKQSFIGICEGEVTSEYDFKHCRFKFEWLLPDYIKAYPNVEVIAWKPLPEPYKAEREE